jgi:MFS family permease
MSVMGGAIYVVFYGMAYSVQDLGLEKINYNGIFFGITQSVGYLIILPFAHKMPRKRWMIIFQIIILIAAGLLFVLSGMPDSDLVRWLKLIVSTCIIAVVNSCQFVFLFAYISELFPTKIRGMANALVLFSSKMIGSFSPMIETFAKNKNLHIMVGCSVVTLISLPLSFFISETLKQSGDETADSEGPASDYETMMNQSESTASMMGLDGALLKNKLSQEDSGEVGE